MTIKSKAVDENADANYVLNLDYCPDCLNYGVFNRLDSATGKNFQQECPCAVDLRIQMPGKSTKTRQDSTRSAILETAEILKCAGTTTCPDKNFYERNMENIIKLTKEEIIDEVKRTGILREHHLSVTTVDLIYSYFDYDCDHSDIDRCLEKTHMIAFFKHILEIYEEYPKDDLEIINLVYVSPIKTLKVNDGYVELFTDHSMLHHQGEELSNIRGYASPCFLNEYVDQNIKIVTAAHDNQYLDPKALTEADRNEILITSMTPLRFHYESDLRTVYSIEEYYKERHWLRTLTLKIPKPTSQKIFRAAIGKLDITHFSEYGAEIVEQTAAQNQYTDPNEFLQIQSTLHLLERKILGYLKEPKLAEKTEPLKKDLLKIQAFKDASADVDQIILPKAEVLVFSDRSVLFAPVGEELESYFDIYQFIMIRLKDLQSVYFSHDRNEWDPKSVSFSSQFNKYGINFSFTDGRVITEFTREFKTRLFDAANVRLV